MNKVAHILILAVFALACWFLWCVLTLASGAGHAMAAHGQTLPGFTTFCIELRPAMIVLPILAAVYCLWVWLRGAARLPSWVTFFAATMSVLVMVTLPTLVAAYLPLVDYMASK